MEADTNRSTLPNLIEALSFVCRCFVVGDPELEGTNTYRMKKMRARKHEGISEQEIERVQQSLLNGIRAAALKPVAGPVAVTDRIATDWFNLYQKLLPRLKVSGVSRVDAMWVLAEHVFVPTLFLGIVSNCQQGLGTEMRASTCWYVPEIVDVKITKKPVQRVLEYWLRATGFRRPNGLSKEIGESNRRKVSNWLEGKPVGSLQELHLLVDQFKEQIAWLDGSESWKARFTLACAIQKAWDEADRFFKSVVPNPSLKLAEAFGALATKRFLQDDNGILVGPNTFFATRLVAMRLERQGKLRKIFANVRGGCKMSFGPEVPDEEIQATRKKIEWETNPGNWFVAHLAKRARRAGLIKSTPSMDYGSSIRNYLFDLGVKELNQLLEKRGRRT